MDPKSVEIYVRNTKQQCENFTRNKFLISNMISKQKAQRACIRRSVRPVTRVSESREIVHVLYYHNKVEIREVRGKLLYSVPHDSITNADYNEAQSIVTGADRIVGSMIQTGLNDWVSEEISTCIYDLPSGVYRLVGVYEKYQVDIPADLPYTIQTDYSRLVNLVVPTTGGPKMCLVVCGNKLAVATQHPKTSFTYIGSGHNAGLLKNGCNCKYNRVVGCLRCVPDFLSCADYGTHRVTTALSIVDSVTIKEIKMAAETGHRDDFIRWFLNEVINTIRLSVTLPPVVSIKTHRYYGFACGVQVCIHGNYEALVIPGSVPTNITLFQEGSGNTKAYVAEL